MMRVWVTVVVGDSLVDVGVEAMVVSDSQRNDSQPEAGAVGAAAVVNAPGVDSFPQTQPQPMTMSPGGGGGGDGGDNPSDDEWGSSSIARYEIQEVD